MHETPISLRAKLHLLPDGIIPKRQSKGAIGFDVSARVVVCPFEMDSQQPHLRKTLFDFHNQPANRKVRKYVRIKKKKSYYILKPGKKVLIGIGFISELPFPWFYWITPRSGLASKHFIQVTNAPGTVDPDYRGEAAASMHNYGKKDFRIYQGMRIAQIVFQKACIPEILLVPDFYYLNETERGSGGFGSTGV